MGIFDSKKIVSEHEFEDVLRKCRSKGFNSRETNEVEKIFHGDLFEKSSQRGIDKWEIEKRLKYMRENIPSHRIPPKKIDILQEILEGKL